MLLDLRLPKEDLQMPLESRLERRWVQVDEIMKEALQQDCDRYAPGVEIIAVRLTKPRIPDSITGNFEAMERERTKVTIAEERERVIIKEAEIERRRAVMQVTRMISLFVISLDLAWLPAAATFCKSL